MPVNFADFHFIRPELLWLLLPACLILIYLRRKAKSGSAWESVISPHLLAFLSQQTESRRRSPWLLSALILLVSIICISGPSFRQQPVPVFESEQARVILLDLSLSMNATDIQPSRLERAKYKLMDLLAMTREGTTALVIYAGDAFTISPLTSDTNTVSNMIPSLSSNIMPVLGSRPDLALAKAIELLQNGKQTEGEIIWLTDGIDPEYQNQVIELAQAAPYQLSILAIGSEQGSPIPLPENGGFLKNKRGEIVVPKLDLSTLSQISSATGAGFVQLTADNADLAYLQGYASWKAQEKAASEQQDSKVNRFVDDGYWLLPLLLLLFFIRLCKPVSSQVLSLFLLVGLSSLTSKAQAMNWQDLWQTKNQQAANAYQQENYEQAASLFEHPDWIGAAEYRQGNFERAAEHFATQKQADNLYNQATSLAKAGKLDQALNLFEQLLEQDPAHEDALFNKKLTEELKNQQQQNQGKQNEQQDQEQSGDQQEQSEQNQSGQDQSKQGQSNQNQSGQNDQGSQEQQGNQAGQDQTNPDQGSEEQQASQGVEDELNKEEQAQQQVQLSQDERDKAEKDQALSHWLEKIPDDPGGLLRRKMYREYQRRGREQKEEKLW